MNYLEQHPRPWQAKEGNTILSGKQSRSIVDANGNTVIEVTDGGFGYSYEWLDGAHELIEFINNL